ncbi:MAG: cation:proton antiporter [Phycisphaerae bacterium]|nr:cation:proton antiporter [Phycisphaerae bacterium]
MLPISDPILIFAVVMAMILIAPLLARRVRLPEIVGLIAAGAIFGPHGLGLLARDQTVQLLGAVGLLYIMFLTGLEIDLHHVRKNRNHAAIFGLLSFAIPMFLGIVLGRWAFGMTVSASFLLAGMLSSHTPLTFSIVSKLGLTKSRSAGTAVGGTIISDTLALLVLVAVASTVNGDVNTWFWVRLFVSMLAYVAGVVFLVPWIGSAFFRHLSTDENTDFVFVLAVALLSSYLAHLAGLEPIIGAFLVGLALNSLIPEKSLLMTRIQFTGNAIFIPFFLLSVGMLVNARLLFTRIEAWVLVVGMVVVAIVAKGIAALVSQRILRYLPDEGLLLFGLTVNRAAATLAIVLVGGNLGLFSDAVVVGAIMTIAVTCLVGSIVTERAGRRVALHEAQGGFDVSAAPHRIMIPLQERQGAKELLEIALLLREKGSHEPLYPLQVVPEDRDVEQKVALAEKVLAHTVVRAMSAGVPVTALTSVDISVISGVVRTLRDNRISMILLDWDGQASSKTRTFGRTIDGIIERSVQLVMVNRLRRPVSTATRIVLVLPPLAERQPGFESVVKATKTLANQAGTSLLILSLPDMAVGAANFIRRTTPSVPVSFRTIRFWKEVRADLDDLAGRNDWLILMAPRKGELAWQPSLDRLPARWAQEFPDTMFSVLIPPDERWESQQAAEKTADSSYIFSTFIRDRTMLRMDVRTTEDAVRRLLGPYFGHRTTDAHEVAVLLHTISQEEPVELTQDVVLLHAHVPHVTESVVFLGVSQEPLDIPLASGGPHILIILLDPVGQDPARHLQALADIARIIRLPDMVRVLRTIPDFDGLVAEIARRTIDK